MIIRHLSAGISWALLILLLCSSPKSELPSTTIWDFFSLDKLAHASIFCILVHLLVVGFKKQYNSFYLRYHAKIWAVAIGITYGIAIELIQMFFSLDRSAEFLDLVANTIGCLSGVVLFRLIYGREFSY